MLNVHVRFKDGFVFVKDYPLSESYGIDFTFLISRHGDIVFCSIDY